MRDYRRKMYLVDREYGDQKSYQTARPETNVQGVTPVSNYESPVSYRAYGSESYNEMMYLFPGYEGIYNQWFDSKVGGQGEDEDQPIKIRAKTNDGYVIRSGDLTYPDWDSVRSATQGSDVRDVKKAPFSGKYQFSEVRSLKPSGINPPSIYRAFVAFDLEGLDENDIKRVGLQLTSHTEYFYFRSGLVLSIQPSNWQPLSILTVYDYDSFYGSYFSIQTFFRGQNLYKFNNYGVNYVKKHAGGVISFCLREYEHDYKNVEPGISEDYNIRFHSADTPSDNFAPTLIINY